ncbi:hypothetical protein BJX64DRAFT_302391 [Aspergillus heterothallicus]
MSGPLTSSGGALNGVPFQLTVDGGAAASGMINFSVNMLARFSQSGIDTFTYTFSMIVGLYIPCGPVGLQRFSDAIEKAPIHSGFDKALWFGFGHKTPIWILLERETGRKFAALSACLAEIYSTNMAAKIMLALTTRIIEENTADGHERMQQPSLVQMSMLVEKCAGIFATSLFPLWAEKFMSLDGETIVGLAAWPHSRRSNGRARVSRGIADVKDISDALYAVMELGQGVTRRVTLVGVADAAAVAAIAAWLLDLRVLLYRTEDEAATDRVWYQNCESEEDAQLVVVHSRRFSPSAVVQRDRTVYLPDATVLFRTGGQLKPSHDHVVSGRVLWEEALQRTFREEFSALMSHPKLLGNAIGSAARVFTGLVEADPAVPPDYLRHCTAYFIGSHGEDFLCGAELESAMLGAATTGTYRAACDLFDRTAEELQQICNCSTCTRDQAPGEPQPSREERRDARMAGPRCMVVMTTAIIRLVRALSGIDFVEELHPSRKGLEYIHRLQTRRVLQCKAWRKAKSGQTISWVNSIIEYAIPDFKDAESSLLRFAQYIFRPDHFTDEYEDHGATAVSTGGLCFYYDILRDPHQDDPINLCRVNVIPGYIQKDDRVFQAITSEATTQLFSFSGRDAKTITRPGTAVPPKAISAAQKSYGGKLQTIATELLTRDFHPSLDVGFQVVDVSGTPTVIVAPAQVVQNVFRSTGFAYCARHQGTSDGEACSGPTHLKQELDAALQQLQSSSDPVTTVKTGKSEIVVFKPDRIVRLVVAAQCWEPILQRGECLLCCLSRGCESQWSDFAVVQSLG